MTKWTLDSMPDQTGRIAIVTGANTGIGFETDARRLWAVSEELTGVRYLSGQTVAA